MRFVCRLIAVFALALVVSCDRESPRTPGEFRFVNRGDIITLDLNQMSYMQDFRVTFAIREGLYTYDPNSFNPLPTLAVSDQVSPDGKTWTFKLRPEANWDNGDPVTAADFVFSWKLMLDAPGQYTSLFYYIHNAREYQNAVAGGKGMSFDQVGIKAIDPHTLEVRLVDPVPFFRDLMAFPTFYPRHAASMEPFKRTTPDGRVSYGEEYTRPGNVVTNGPFKLVEWVAGSRLRMEKNPHYWDAANVKLNAVEQRNINDAQTQQIQYEQGEIDWIADVSHEIAFPLKEKGRTDLRVSPAFGTAFVTVNTAPNTPDLGQTANPFADQRVRHAVSLAINRQTLVQSVTRMGEKPAKHYMPPGFFEGYDAPPIDLEGGIDRAKRLLAEAGYPDGKGFPTVGLLYNSDNNIRRDLATSIANQLRSSLGINIEARPIELGAYRTQVTQKQYTLALAAWYGDYMDPSTFADKYESVNENNDSNWAPPEYDQLLMSIRGELDPAKRFDLLEQAEAMINRELPIIPLYHYMNISLHRDNVKGLVTNAKNLTMFKTISIE